ncbi:MAG: bifunctional riboflavin kinase/FAD synthetase [Candidatus Aureabacteria bacterium]|nr:bifunctional riboflavin kinase/FAD synthetase [Candidatus Auribacterota bacterium]
MKIIDDLKNYDGKDSISLAIGVFDGVHKGHARVIGNMVKEAKANDLVPSVLTFRSTPKWDNHKKWFHLTSFEHKEHLLERIGCKSVFTVSKSDEWFFKMSPKEFVHEIIIKKLKCKSVTVGINFNFGRSRVGSIDDLRVLFDESDIKLSVIDMMKEDDTVISSSLIKQFIEKNSFELASRYLGRYYSIGGTVVKGLGLGAKIGIPTANLDISDETIPMNGIFVCVVKSDTIDGVLHGLVSVGTNPTVSENSFQKVEVHILDFKKDLLGDFVEIYPIEKIRDTKKFPSMQDLKLAIEKDIKHATHFFNTQHIDYEQLIK